MEQARAEEEAEGPNPLDPTTRLCHKKVHYFDSTRFRQCPACQKESRRQGAKHETPKGLFKKLWRSLCLDVAQIHAKAAAGSRLKPHESKQLLEYLKFVQEEMALKELELEQEKKDDRNKKTRGKPTTLVDKEDQTPNNGSSSTKTS